MNSTANPDSQEDRIAYYASEQISHYASLAIFVIVLFEYLITFDREVDFAWGQKLSWAKCIFFLNRYFTILEYFITVLGSVLPITDYFSCVFLVRLLQAVQIVLYATWAAFSGIRVYAISTRSWTLTSVVVMFAMVPVATEAYLATQERVVLQIPGHCTVNVGAISSSSQIELSVAMRSCMVISDITAVAVTWVRMWGAMQMANKLHTQISFMSLVLKDGTLHFIVLQSANTLRIAFNFSDAPDSAMLALSFLTVITPVLISRFFLDLHDLTTSRPQPQYTSAPPTAELSPWISEPWNLA